MTKRRKKVRGNSRYFIYWTLIILVLYVSFNTAFKYLKNTDLFKVTRIEIRGTKFLNPEFLHSVSQSYYGKNIFDINNQEIENLYTNVIRVKTVKCRKRFPSKLTISITERTGVFFIRNTAGEFFPVDYDRVVLDKADSYLKEDLPFVNLSISREKLVPGNVIEDVNLEYVFQVYDELIKHQPSIISDISEFYFRSSLLHFVDIETGSRVIIGEDEIASQIKRFLFLRQNQGFEKQSFVDLRFPNQIIVR